MMNANAIPAYMRQRGPDVPSTEEYVAIPPALIIIESSGVVWTLGTNMITGPRGEYAFDVLRNGHPTGEYASRVERRGGRIRIFCVGGWKHWNGRSFI